MVYFLSVQFAVEKCDTMCAEKREFKCKNDPQKFCHACGLYIFKAATKFTPSLQTAYHHYFKVKPENLDKPWVPAVLCGSCRTRLSRWMSDERYVYLLHCCIVCLRWSYEYMYLLFSVVICGSIYQQNGANPFVTWPIVISV